MKKATLFAAAMFVCMAIFTQQQTIPNPKFKTVKAPAYEMATKQLQDLTIRKADYTKQTTPTPPVKSIDFVNIINLGSANNAWGYAGNKHSVLWADENLNTITHFHRLGGDLQGNSYNYGYDISTDGGLNWINQNFCISGLPFGLRYPHHGIFNPPGNTDPNEAYIVFFGPCLDQSNSPDSWGGYYYGRMKIGDPGDTTVHIKPSHEGFYQNIPQGFCVTQTGEVWVADLNQDWSSGTLNYQGSAIINHGVWNDEQMDFVYEEFLIPCPTIDNTRPADQKIAYAPDGMTGYMAVLADNGEVPISAGRSYFPILWKTIDGGDTWEGPISVPIAGPDGIEEVKNFLSDEELAEVFGFIPDRDSIEFATAYDFDLHVDAWGRPHIAVVIGITGEDPYSFITGQSTISGYMFAAAFDITCDATQNWKGYELGRLKTFRGYFGDLTEDNRIQIASAWDGDFMFVTWNDTDLPGIEDNQNPDIWCRGIDVMNGYLTYNNGGEDEPYNVTEFSEGMWQAYFHSLSQYAFLEISYWEGIFTIPMTYQEMNPEDPSFPVQFKYITDFTITVYIDGLHDSKMNNQEGISVSGPMPNPASNVASITIYVVRKVNLDLAVYNLTGQKVFELPQKSYPPGNHPVNIDVSGFEPGIYFLTVASEGSKISRKMIVE